MRSMTVSEVIDALRTWRPDSYVGVRTNNGYFQVSHVERFQQPSLQETIEYPSNYITLDCNKES